MSKIIFDIANLLALIMISVGVGYRFGWDMAVIVGGALLMAINFCVVTLMTKGN